MILGLVSGYYLHQFLIQMIAPGTFRFQPKVGWEVYLIPVLAVSVILTILGVFVNHYLEKLDMLEALKSVRIGFHNKKQIRKPFVAFYFHKNGKIVRVEMEF